MEIQIDEILEAHNIFVQKLLSNQHDKTFTEIHDTHECKMGTFISHYRNKHDELEILNEVDVLHRKFHYYASVIALHQNLGIYPEPEIVKMLLDSSYLLVERFRGLYK